MKKSALVVGLLLLSLRAFAENNPCSYVEYEKNFEPGKHGALLASYVNWTPVGAGIGDRADRDDDQIGVCRIFEDGTIFTSYGCAGDDSVKKAHTRIHATIVRLKTEASAPGAVDRAHTVAPYTEAMVDNDFDKPIWAIAGDGDQQGLVDKTSPLADLVRSLCPLDNEPAHRGLVR